MNYTCKTMFTCLAFTVAASFSANQTMAAGSVAAKTCSQLKSLIKKKGRVYMRTRFGTKEFVYSNFYCDQGDQTDWQIVQSRSGKCYLHICRPYQNWR